MIMRQMIWCALVIFLLAQTAIAQTHRKKIVARKQQTVSVHNKLNKNQSLNALQANSSYILSNNSSHNAYANKITSTAPSQFKISDPLIIALNERANGANVKVSSSGIVGISKHNYGFANGHIILHTTGSTTTGTSTGSGAVGTGTSLGTFGSTGQGVEVNGKSPYAGAGMYGTERGMLNSNDSTHRIKRKG